MSEPVVIFGATGGLGSAIAKRLHAASYALILHGRDQEKLNALGDRLSVPSEDRLLGDCTDQAAVERMFAVVRARHQALSGAVFSLATPFANKLAHRLDWKIFDDQMVSQLKALHLISVATKSLLASASGSGKYVIISSEFAIGAPPVKTAPYAAAKAAMTAYARVIAQEWLRDGTRVHILAPGMVKTDLLRDIPDQFLDQVAEAMPEKRLTGAEDVADLVAFCLTDAADTLYGTPIRVSRGQR